MGSTPRPGRARAVAVIVLAGACLFTTAASAAPVPDKHTQADQLAQQLDDQGQHIAVLDEQFNQARARADALDAEVAAIGPKLADSNRQLAAARQRLVDASVDAYVRGGASPLIGALIKGRSEDFGVRKTYVDAALDGQRGAMAGFESARHRLLALRDQLRGTQRQARATADTLDANRRAAQATIASQQAALSQAQGDMAPLVAEASAARAQRTEQQGKQKFDTLAAPPATAAPKGGSGGAPGHAAPPKPASGPAAAPPTTARPSSPPGTSAPAPAPAPTGPAPPVKSGASAAVNTAKAQLGKPYVYGAAGPDSFDCSGLTMYAWRAGGVGLPHSAEMQYAAIAHISVSQLQPGDLIFYGTPIHHVGIYVGGGQMIEAPYTGAVVRYASIYRSDLVGAGRP